MPVVVTAEGGVLSESSAIVRWADARTDPGDRLYPDGAEGREAARIEAWLDSGLGPDGRLWMYESTLPAMDRLAPWILAGTPRWEGFVLRWGSRAFEPVIRRRLRVSATNAVAARGRVEAVFDEVARLSPTAGRTSAASASPPPT